MRFFVILFFLVLIALPTNAGAQGFFDEGTMLLLREAEEDEQKVWGVWGKCYSEQESSGEDCPENTFCCQKMGQLTTFEGCACMTRSQCDRHSTWLYPTIESYYVGRTWFCN